MLRCDRVEDGREWLRPDRDRRFRGAERLAIRSRDQRERLGVVLDLAADRDEDAPLVFAY